MLNTFIELCGYGEVKPFECVGTSEEVNYAISKTIKQLETEGKELPYLLTKTSIQLYQIFSKSIPSYNFHYKLYYKKPHSTRFY